MSQLPGACDHTTVAGAAILYSPRTSDPKLPARARNTQCVLRLQCLREAPYTEIANSRFARRHALDFMEAQEGGSLSEREAEEIALEAQKATRQAARNSQPRTRTK